MEDDSTSGWKPTIITPDKNKLDRRSLQGKPYLDILDFCESIASHQKREVIEKGIKGFIFHGEVGVGKTTLAKALAGELGVRLAFVDGSDIARPLYGQSESQIDRVFEDARRAGYTVVLIDDCESVFPTRDWEKGESWHLAQNNVFFHCLDDLDTSKVIVILTTNRYDLLDKAVKDRLFPIEFPAPTPEVLATIAEAKCADVHVPPETIVDAALAGKYHTVRDLEKSVTTLYIERLKRKGGPLEDR
jgi:SpoVK/Ycf46/Vps4 family AAA+-type ATPase